MTEFEWVKIPVPIADEKDRRDLCAILSSVGMEVRITRQRKTKNASPQRFVEYRETGSFNVKTEE